MNLEQLDPVELTRQYHESGGLTPETVTAFRAMILDYYRANSRPMPWRETRDPYAILVSEVMLQQTQVARVRIKYDEFLVAFPQVGDLAVAPLSEVLLLWQGLGYNRRALALKRCAETIMKEHDGRFPSSIAELQSLPGIGSYTARAVAAFAFDVAEPLIETNVRTVFLHWFFHGYEKVGDAEILPLVEATLDRDNPREWYYALMDYGVMLKQVLPNPGRRSRHHTKQSRFEGSNRQLRSRLLREIMAEPGLALECVVVRLAAESDAVERNLEAMQREGLLVRQGEWYYVAGENKRGQR
jgi:A/G-specific adenine glycosylase